MENARMPSGRNMRAWSGSNPELLLRSVGTIFTHTLLQWQSADNSECMSLEQAARASEEAALKTV